MENVCTFYYCNNYTIRDCSQFFGYYCVIVKYNINTDNIESRRVDYTTQNNIYYTKTWKNTSIITSVL